jgi:hypothetical protein
LKILGLFLAPNIRSHAPQTKNHVSASKGSINPVGFPQALDL